MSAVDRPIVVFDAACIICFANARFILKHDRRRRFRLAAMQSEAGRGLYRQFGIDPNDPETLLVVEGERALRDSDAVLAIYARLGWPWRAAAVLRVVPKRVRDRLYRWVARHRYRLFGRREPCRMPQPGDAERML